ncbi:MAG TPA: hypothetical protein VK879_14935 [Candidatus Sulfomarinibacteraceae bacterium]|nr:hypothetical protein [Candidatus Sulfomarinibacteraceae bacterium]
MKQTQEQADGERRLRRAARRIGPRRQRSQRKPAADPLNLEPTTPFEQAILHHYQELRRDYEDLKKRVDWLTISIVGAALTFVLETIFTR